MEVVIRILMLFIVVNCALKLSFWRWWQAAIFGAVCAAFVVAAVPAAAGQSKTQLADFLADRRVMQDMAVLVTLEAALCLAWCFLASRKIYGGMLSRWGRTLQWYVSLLVFPVLFYLLTQAIYRMPGTDFQTTGWAVAAIVAAGFPLLRYAVKTLLPEKDFRLEVHFLASLFACVLGLISTVNGNVAYAAVEHPADWRMLSAAALLFAAAFLAGAAWNKLKWRKRTDHPSRRKAAGH